MVTKEMTVRDGRGALDVSVCHCGDACPGGTLLANPVGVITGEMTFREECGVLGCSIYKYDDGCDCGPDYCDCSQDYFDYDGLEDFGHCPDVNGFVGPDGRGYGLCRDFHDPGDWDACCVSRGDAGVMPYESGTGGSGIDENVIAFKPTGSDQRCIVFLEQPTQKSPVRKTNHPKPSPVG